MEPKVELENWLDALKREFRARRSLLEMMEKGSTRRDLEELRQKELVPLEKKIKELEDFLRGQNSGEHQAE